MRCKRPDLPAFRMASTWGVEKHQQAEVLLRSLDRFVLHGMIWQLVENASQFVAEGTRLFPGPLTCLVTTGRARRMGTSFMAQQVFEHGGLGRPQFLADEPCLLLAKHAAEFVISLFQRMAVLVFLD